MPKDKINKKTKNFRFVTHFANVQTENRNRYQPDHKLYKFHQICMYKDLKSNKYNVRTLTLDENQNIVKETVKLYTEEQCNALISSSKDHEYTIYPTYDLDLVAYPNVDDLLKTQSELLQ